MHLVLSTHFFAFPIGRASKLARSKDWAPRKTFVHPCVNTIKFSNYCKFFDGAPFYRLLSVSSCVKLTDFVYSYIKRKQFNLLVYGYDRPCISNNKKMILQNFGLSVFLFFFFTSCFYSIIF